MKKPQSSEQDAYEEIRNTLYGLYAKHAEKGMTLAGFVTMATLALADGFRAVAAEQYGIEYESQYQT